MIRFAPKTTPAVKIAKPNTDIELADSIAAVQKVADDANRQADPATGEPAAILLLELSGEPAPKVRKTGSRKRREAGNPTRLETGNRGHDRNAGDLLLDL
ncbi:hypothetical protein [Rhizobium sp. GCM10022189]|jgi:hypothetical protein|uniref:hypothetical protein n=1 Tax=Rhizobium sp. GCM10022189 TaxID=3252654 RepID=UPI000DE4CEEE